MLKRHSIYLLLAAMMVHLAACSFTSQSLCVTVPTSKNTHQSQTLLTARQTHNILRKWSEHNFRTDHPELPISLTNKHKYAKSFHTIISGYDVSTFCHRSKGIGLPVVIQTSKDKFKPLTKRAFQSNLYPGTLVLTRLPNGKLNAILFDPRDQRKCFGRQLKTQHNIVIDHVHNDPNNKALDLGGLINPLKYKNLQGFYLSRPYDKNKIPVIMIHGIFSSPRTFMDMAERIEEQPDLFQKYQIWHYYYPTGTPWLATAHDFRTSYRGLIKKLDPSSSHANIRKTIIIAHSMGGLITRLSLSEPKKHLTKAYLGKQGPSVLTPAQHRKLHPYFHFRPLTEPKQVIFLAVPHRGSKMASGFIGWATDKFIAIPNILLRGTARIIRPYQESKLSPDTLRLLTEGENAVTQLQPNNPALKALNQMQLPSHLKVHSLIGDIGLPVFRFYTDGVVTYRSAHLSTKGSETLIPSNHDITDDPKSVLRVMQILRQ